MAFAIFPDGRMATRETEMIPTGSTVLIKVCGPEAAAIFQKFLQSGSVSQRRRIEGSQVVRLARPLGSTERKPAAQVPFQLTSDNCLVRIEMGGKRKDRYSAFIEKDGASSTDSVTVIQIGEDMNWAKYQSSLFSDLAIRIENHGWTGKTKPSVKSISRKPISSRAEGERHQLLDWVRT
jgi:hypothetical protein